MGTVTILRRIFARMQPVHRPASILELGGGDGTLLLRLAGAIRPRWPDVHLTILDQHDLVSERTREAFRRMDWHISVQQCDVLDWAQTPLGAHIDLCLANLFLHHFQTEQLAVVLRAAENRAQTFVACEPQRGILAWLGSACVGLIGANAVTRSDAIKSVAAGFRGNELTQLWPQSRAGWRLQEFRAWPFSHCFIASRSSAPAL